MTTILRGECLLPAWPQDAIEVLVGRRRVRRGSLADVSPIALRTKMRRWRHHAAALAILLALVGVVAVHHGAPAMSNAHHGSDMVALAEMCLGVFTAVGAAVVAFALGFLALGRWRPEMLHCTPGVLEHARAPQPRTRAGPALLVLLCVSRR